MRLSGKFLDYHRCAFIVVCSMQEPPIYNTSLEPTPECSARIVALDEFLREGESVCIPDIREANAGSIEYVQLPETNPQSHVFSGVSRWLELPPITALGLVAHGLSDRGFSNACPAS